jgi:hypothetical protein
MQNFFGFCGKTSQGFRLWEFCGRFNRGDGEDGFSEASSFHFSPKTSKKAMGRHRREIRSEIKRPQKIHRHKKITDLALFV